MKSHELRLVLLAMAALCAATIAGDARAQALPAAPAPAADSNRFPKFFQSEEPLAMTLTLNIKRIRSDKDSNPPWRQATMSYTPAGAAAVTVPVRVRTRGIWRLKTCEFPPLRLNFANDPTKKTIFHGLDRPKLVDYCRDDNTYEQYLLQEFQLYRIYRLLTPASHAVRLIKMTYADSGTNRLHTTRYAFIEEDPDALALRMGGKMLKIKGAGPADLEPVQDAIVGMFQYLIGNTDFALGALHNAELLSRSNGDNFPIVYDFDFAGAVNARYATVDARLHLRTVRDRLYRGYCVPTETYPQVVALFNAKKDAIYALYRDPLGKLLPQGVVDETLKYFDEFYRTINEPKRLKSEIIDQCLK